MASNPVTLGNMIRAALTGSSAPPDASAADNDVAADVPVNVQQSRAISLVVLILSLLFLMALPFALHALKPILLPIMCAVVFALLLNPLANWLDKYLPTRLSVSLSVVAFCAILILGILTVVMPLVSWVSSFSSFAETFRVKAKPLYDMFENAAQMAQSVTGKTESVASGSNTIMSTGLSYLMATPVVAVQFAFVLLLTFAFLHSREQIKNNLILNRGSLSGSLTVARMLRDIQPQVSRYLATMTVINMGYGLSVGVALWMLGVPAPVMWGGLAMLLNFIPYAGPIILTAGVGLGALIGLPTPLHALAPMATVFALHFIEANIVTPMVVGKRFSLNPAAILISLSFFGWVWGVIGALLATPLLLIIQTIYARLDTPDLIGVAIGEKTIEDI